MADVSVYNGEGKVLRTISLDEAVFGASANDTLLREVYMILSGNARQVLAHTKNRGERKGSGKKPWKQKHTGRARAGSVRSPLWRKGGVVFGPNSDRNFSRKINRKVRRKAVVTALSGKVRERSLLVVDSFDFSEGKTKRLAVTLKTLGTEQKSILFAFASGEYLAERAGRNIQKLSTVPAHMVNAKDLLDHRFLLVSEATIREIEKRCLSEEGKI